MHRPLAVTERLLNWQSAWAAVILLGVLHLCFFSCIWGNKTLLESARDQPSIMSQGAYLGSPQAVPFPKMLDTGAPAWVPEPFLVLIGKDYTKERNAPLWNPYQAYGLPLAANMQSQPFFPLSVALSFHLTPRTYSWFILLRLYLAGISAYLFIRFFVSFVPALAAGITTMLAGYYVLFITMPHLSVEALLPVALLTGERLLRRPTYWTTVALSVVISLAVLGGMPESTLILLAFLYLYLAFRLLTDPRLHSRWSSRTMHVAIATIAGAALSAFLLLPFREYMTLAFDMHQPSNIGGSITGLGHDPRGLSIFTYFFPLIFGPPFSSTLSPGWNGLRNYAGLISLFLALASIFGSSWRRGRRDRLLTSLTWFFGSCVAAVVLKRYGFAPINIIGALPFFKLVQFAKYEEVVLSICMSMLCAIGIERLMRGQVSVFRQSAALALSFLPVPIALAASWRILANEILVQHIALGFPVWAIGLPVCLLFCIAVLIILSGKEPVFPNLWRRASVSIFATSLLLLLSGEVILNYIAPAYYAFDSRLPTRVANPFLGAPFVDELTARSAHYRIFAEDRILFPNWASAFGLFDIRALDAMYYKRYFPFLRAFFPPKVRGYGEELEDRFTGQGDFDFADPLQKRLLQLSSVRYVVASRPITVPSTVVAEILSQTKGRILAGKETFISRQTFILDNEAREALGEHPPYDRLPYRLAVENGNEDLHFSYGLNPAIFDHSCGDGVEFIVEAKSASGQISKLFSSYIDPKHDVKQRHWIDASVDLSRYRGQLIELLLSTNGGPKGDTCADWAAWSNFHYGSGQSGINQPFDLIYNKEVKIYEYKDALPRAAVYYSADVRNTGGEVLAGLADPKLNVLQSVLLDRSEFSESQLAMVKAINEAPATSLQPAAITSYVSRSVTIEANIERNGILVLNDTNYPGWTVDVDGHKGSIISANYLFRGVLLSPGKHTVRFAYNPQSFRLGLAISSIAFVLLAAWGVALIALKRRKGGEDQKPSASGQQRPSQVFS